MKRNLRQPRKACGICGRDVARRRGGRTGKACYPHKCPHGYDCVAGHPLLGLHANSPQVPKGSRYGCPDCWELHKISGPTQGLGPVQKAVEQVERDPSARVWPIAARCLFVGCFYPEGDRCAFCLQPRPLAALGRSPLESRR